MGCYINPTSESKEEFLFRCGEEVTLGNFKNAPEGKLPVVLVHNGFFTAAGIAYSDGEVAAFTDPSDGRPKMYFWVDVDELKSVSDLNEYLERG